MALLDEQQVISNPRWESASFEEKSKILEALSDAYIPSSIGTGEYRKNFDTLVKLNKILDGGLIERSAKFTGQAISSVVGTVASMVPTYSVGASNLIKKLSGNDERNISERVVGESFEAGYKRQAAGLGEFLEESSITRATKHNEAKKAFEDFKDELPDYDPSVIRLLTGVGQSDEQNIKAAKILGEKDKFFRDLVTDVYDEKTPEDYDNWKGRRSLLNEDQRNLLGSYLKTGNEDFFKDYKNSALRSKEGAKADQYAEENNDRLLGLKKEWREQLDNDSVLKPFNEWMQDNIAGLADSPVDLFSSFIPAKILAKGVVSGVKGASTANKIRRANIIANYGKKSGANRIKNASRAVDKGKKGSMVSDFSQEAGEEMTAEVLDNPNPTAGEITKAGVGGVIGAGSMRFGGNIAGRGLGYVSGLGKSKKNTQDAQAGQAGVNGAATNEDVANRFNTEPTKENEWFKSNGTIVIGGDEVTIRNRKEIDSITDILRNKQLNIPDEEYADAIKKLEKIRARYDAIFRPKQQSQESQVPTVETPIDEQQPVQDDNERFKPPAQQQNEQQQQDAELEAERERLRQALGEPETTQQPTQQTNEQQAQQPTQETGNTQTPSQVQNLPPPPILPPIIQPTEQTNETPTQTEGEQTPQEPTQERQAETLQQQETTQDGADTADGNVETETVVETATNRREDIDGAPELGLGEDKAAQDNQQNETDTELEKLASEELPQIPNTKAGLAAEVAGQAPSASASYITRQQHEKLIKSLKKFTVAELRSMVEAGRARVVKNKETATRTLANYAVIERDIENAGTKWRRKLARIAAKNGDEGYKGMPNNNKGEEIYRLADRLAQRGVTLAAQIPTQTIGLPAIEPTTEPTVDDMGDDDFEKKRRDSIISAIEDEKYPISIDAVKEYRIELPEGYVLEENVYVYRPDTSDPNSTVSLLSKNQAVGDAPGYGAIRDLYVEKDSISHEVNGKKPFGKRFSVSRSSAFPVLKEDRGLTNEQLIEKYPLEPISVRGKTKLNKSNSIEETATEQEPTQEELDAIEKELEQDKELQAEREQQQREQDRQERLATVPKQIPNNLKEAYLKLDEKGRAKMLEDFIDDPLERLAASNGVEIENVDSADEIGELDGTNFSENDKGRIEGVAVGNNKVVLVNDNIDSPKRKRQVFLHELVGHIGVDRFLESIGMSWTDARKSLEATAKKELEAAAQNRFNKSYEQLTDEQKDEAAMEAVAKAAETDSAAEPQWFKRLVKQIQEAVQRVLKQKVTPAEIKEILRGGRKNLTKENSGNNQAGNVRPSLSEGGRSNPKLTKTDEDYLKAVDDGDIGNDNLRQLLRDAPKEERKAVMDSWVKRNPKSAELLQKIVDEEAKKAGHKIKAQHGTSGEFNIFSKEKMGAVTAAKSARKAFFFVDDRPVANQYAKLAAMEIGEGKERVIDARIKGNLKVVDHGGKSYEDMQFSSEIQKAKDEGYDGVMFKNTNDSVFNELIGYEPLPKIDIKVSKDGLSMALRRGDFTARGEVLKNGFTRLSTQGGLSKLIRSSDPVIVSNVFEDISNRALSKKPIYKDFRHTVYAVFNPNQIKSADQITYDDAGNIIPPSQRFNEKNDDIRFSLSEGGRSNPKLTKTDRDYLRSVDDGDMETAQRIVDEAAMDVALLNPPELPRDLLEALEYGKKAEGLSDMDSALKTPDWVFNFGFETSEFFEAGRRGEIPEYVVGFRFGDLPERGRSTNWADNKAEPGVSLAYAHRRPEQETNPITMTGVGSRQKVLLGGWAFPKSRWGSDGEIVILNPSKIKSADPITYDDAGNVIPPSQRFNEKNNDIRFSLSQGSDNLRGGGEQNNEAATPKKQSVIFNIGRNIANIYIKRKVTRFADFAQRVKKDFPNEWDSIKDILKPVWDSAAQQSPELDEASREEARQIIADIEAGKTPTIISAKPVKSGSGNIQETRAFKKIKATIDTDLKLGRQPEYERMRLASDRVLGIEYAKNNYEKALKIAKGLMPVPEGMSGTSIISGAIDYALETGRTADARDLIHALDSRSTRLGQEIVALRERYEADDVVPIARELLNRRGNRALNNDGTDTKKKKESYEKKLKSRAESGANQINKNASKMMKATEFLKSLLC